jgi:nucleoside-diphosphate-sugar epimerase
MNVLVTGATGFIGRNLIKELSRGNSVHVLTRPTTDSSAIVADGIFVFQDNIAELAEYLRDNEIEGIIHLASLFVSEHKIEQVKPLISSNVYLGTALLEACRLAGTKWFLNTGTIWQNYNSVGSEYNPVNLYAATKQAFMDVARYYVETDGIRFCTLKLCDTYGPGDTRRKLFALLKEYSENGQTLNMSPGEQKIDLLYITDIVAGFIRLAEMLSNGTKLKDEYVLSSGEQVRLKDMVDIFCKVSGRTLKINWGGRPYRAREVMIPWKGEVLPGWKAEVSLQNGIKMFLKEGEDRK